MDPKRGDWIRITDLHPADNYHGRTDIVGLVGRVHDTPEQTIPGFWGFEFSCPKAPSVWCLFAAKVEVLS